MKRLSIIGLAVLFATPIASTAQETTTGRVPLRPGERVRVTGRFCQPFDSNCVRGSPQQNVGALVTWNADTLVMESHGDILTLAQGSMTTLEVSAGQRSQAGVGARRGGLIGAAVGATVGLATCDGFFPPHVCVLGGGLMLGAGGTLIGVIVGITNKKERWVAVPLNRLRVSFVPLHDGGLGLGASVRF